MSQTQLNPDDLMRTIKSLRKTSIEMQKLTRVIAVAFGKYRDASQEDAMYVKRAEDIQKLTAMLLNISDWSDAAAKQLRVKYEEAIRIANM